MHENASQNAQGLSLDDQQGVISMKTGAKSTEPLLCSAGPSRPDAVCAVEATDGTFATAHPEGQDSFQR